MPARTRPPSAENRFYRPADLARIFDITERTVFTWIAAGELPQPIRKSRKWTGWPKEQIDELVRQWTAGKSGKPARHAQLAAAAAS